MKTLHVTTRNQWFQRAEVLKRNRTRRMQAQQFFVEGVRAINQLRQPSVWRVEALLYNGEKSLSRWAQEILHEVESPYHLALSAELMAELSDKEDTSEVLALVNMPSHMLPAPEAIGALTLILDRPSNPGNLGSIIRSCDAFGVKHIGLVGHAVDPFDPVVIRASAGAFFSTHLFAFDSHETFMQWVEAIRSYHGKLCIAGASAHGQTSIDAAVVFAPCLLLIGNETLGLSAWLKDRCDMLVGIPMRGVASSLNVACATSIFLHELTRQLHVKS